MPDCISVSHEHLRLEPSVQSAMVAKAAAMWIREPLKGCLWTPKSNTGEKKNNSETWNRMGKGCLLHIVGIFLKYLEGFQIDRANSSS